MRTDRLTECEWLACTDRETMLLALRRFGTSRKRRLFACALCRRIWHLIEEGPCRRAVEVSERYADGQIGTRELLTALKATWQVVHKDAGRTPANDAGSSLTHAMGINDMVSQAVRAAELAIEGEGDQRVAALAALAAAHCDLVRCMLAHPYAAQPAADPAWLVHHDSTPIKLARAIYEERRFELLPILADALEDAGCDRGDVFDHCRKPGEHARGCWVVDLVLGAK